MDTSSYQSEKEFFDAVTILKSGLSLLSDSNPSSLSALDAFPELISRIFATLNDRSDRLRREYISARDGIGRHLQELDSKFKAIAERLPADNYSSTLSQLIDSFTHSDKLRSLLSNISSLPSSGSSSPSVASTDVTSSSLISSSTLPSPLASSSFTYPSQTSSSLSSPFNNQSSSLFPSATSSAHHPHVVKVEPVEPPVSSASSVTSPSDFYTTLSLTDVFTGSRSPVFRKTPPPAYTSAETTSTRVSSSVLPAKSVRHHPYASSSPPLVSQPPVSAAVPISLPSSPLDKFKACWHSAIYPSSTSSSTKSSSAPLLYTPGCVTYVKSEPQIPVSRLSLAAPSNAPRPRLSSLNSTLSSSSSDTSQPPESSSSSSLPSIPDSDTPSERITRLRKLIASNLNIQSSSSSSSGSSTVQPSPCPTPSMGSFVTITPIFSIAPQTVYQPVLPTLVSSHGTSSTHRVSSPIHQVVSQRIPTPPQPPFISSIVQPPLNDSQPVSFSSSSFTPPVSIPSHPFCHGSQLNPPFSQPLRVSSQPNSISTQSPRIETQLDSSSPICAFGSPSNSVSPPSLESPPNSSSSPSLHPNLVDDQTSSSVAQLKPLSSHSIPAAIAISVPASGVSLSEISFFSPNFHKQLARHAPLSCPPSRTSTPSPSDCLSKSESGSASSLSSAVIPSSTFQPFSTSDTQLFKTPKLPIKTRRSKAFSQPLTRPKSAPPPSSSKSRRAKKLKVLLDRLPI